MFTLAQLSAKQMLKQGSGNIINIGSIQAYQPTFGILDYASTKVNTVSLAPLPLPLSPTTPNTFALSDLEGAMHVKITGDVAK